SGVEQREGHRKGPVNARIGDENRFAHDDTPGLMVGPRARSASKGLSLACAAGSWQKSLLLDAIQMPVAAQQYLLADQHRRGVDGVVQLVGRQDLQLD